MCLALPSGVLGHVGPSNARRPARPLTLAPKQVGHVAVTVAIPMKHQPGEHLLGVEFFESMVIATAERLLALPPGTLAPVMEG